MAQTFLHPRPLMKLIEAGEEREAHRMARNLTEDGFVGAAAFEILSLVAMRTPQAVGQAKQRALRLRPRELYSSVPIRLPVETDLTVKLASWILRHDWDTERSDLNPAMRLQKCISAFQGGAPDSPIASAIHAEALAAKGRFTESFDLLRQTMKAAPEESFTRWSALSLLRRIDQEGKQNYLQYRKDGVNAFVVAPVGPGRFICTELLGTVLDGTELYREKAPGLPDVRLIEDSELSADEIAKILYFMAG